MFGLDLLIIEGITSIGAWFGCGFIEGLGILTGVITYAVAAVKVEGRNNK